MDYDAFAPFGELLKTFRQRKKMTQQQLSVELGVHRNTIGGWERGDFLPDSKGVVLEVARLLSLRQPEMRQLLDASLTTPSLHWSVPYQRNPFFTGRAALLGSLHQLLGIDHAAALTQSYALHGLGGIGKTQLALEYAYQYALEYCAVFWIEAETLESIVASMVRIAEHLKLPECSETDQLRIVTAVQHWLTTHDTWLLIWDNVEHVELLQRFLPASRCGAILLTTRHQTLGTLAQSIELPTMTSEEGVLFLLRRAKMLPLEMNSEQTHQFATRMPGEYDAAEKLIVAIEGLPLALDQAGAFIEETGCSLSAYLELFCTQRAALLRQRGKGSQDHPESVNTTFALAITTTARSHPVVGDLLRVCALLQPEAIPEELFRQGARYLSLMLEETCHNMLDWNRVIATARSYSLLHRQPEEQTLSMHRLVQVTLLDALTEAELEQWTQRVMNALEAVFPEVHPSTENAAWKQGERLLPHTLLCLGRARDTEESLTFSSLAYKAAQYLRERGRYTEAEPLYQRVLSIQERVLGVDHPQVATSLSGLAVLYRRQGNYRQAEPLFQQALYIWVQELGPDHPQIAGPLNGLASIYCDQGKYEQAEPLFRRAVSIREQALGPEHPQVASLLNNLAILYAEQGKDKQAEEFLLRAIHIWEQALGSEHPQIAFSLANLAELYQRQRRDLEAEALYLRSLHIWEQTLGPEHPEVALSLNDLANLYREQGKYAEAEALYQRARSIREQSLGSLHPETAQTLHDFALCYQKQEKLTEAASLYKRALDIRAQALGNSHPKTVATRTQYVTMQNGSSSNVVEGSSRHI